MELSPDSGEEAEESRLLSIEGYYYDVVDAFGGALPKPPCLGCLRPSAG